MKLVLKTFKWLVLGLYVACALAVLIFLTPVGGWKALDVLTGSMRPVIQPGTLVLVHKVPISSIKVGNIVTYINPHDPAETITHRVIKISKVKGLTTFTVKGDANKIADPPFQGGYIVGQVVFIIPGAGKFMNILHNPYGLAALVIIPGLLVIWLEGIRLKRELSIPLSSPEPTATNNKPEPPSPVRQATPTKPATQRQRSIDGMRHIAILPIALSLVVIAVGVTHAAIVGAVSLTNNSFTVVSSPTPSPTASPCSGNFTISNTGPGSTNIVTCTDKTSSSSTNINNVTVNNSSTQSSSSGSGSSSSNTNNTNSSTTNVTLNNY